MVHQYKLNGYNIVLDTCSGSVHLVDDVAYDAIALYPDLPRQAIAARLLQKYAGPAPASPPPTWSSAWTTSAP